MAFNISNINLTCEINMDEITLKPIKYEFNDEIKNHKLNDKGLHIFEFLIKQPIMWKEHISEGTLENGKTFFIKYFTHYFQMQNRNLLLISSTRVVALWLSQHAYTTHTQCRILLCGNLFVLSQRSQILERLKHAHVIIVDEMSMMTNVVFCANKQRLKQTHNNSNPFTNMLLLLVTNTK